VKLNSVDKRADSSKFNPETERIWYSPYDLMRHVALDTREKRGIRPAVE